MLLFFEKISSLSRKYLLKWFFLTHKTLQVIRTGTAEIAISNTRITSTHSFHNTLLSASSSSHWLVAPLTRIPSSNGRVVAGVVLVLALTEASSVFVSDNVAAWTLKIVWKGLGSVGFISAKVWFTSRWWHSSANYNSTYNMDKVYMICVVWQYVAKCAYHAFECVHEHSIGWEFPVGLGYIRGRNMSPACVQLSSRLLHLSDHWCISMTSWTSSK